MAPQPNESFREIVERLLQERDWSWRKMARQIKALYPESVHHGTISTQSNGKDRLSKRTMELVAAVLEIPPSTFLEYQLETARENLDWHKRGLPEAMRYFRARGLHRSN